MSNWYEYPRWREEYEIGLDEYLEDAFATRVQGDQISCPCEKCCYRYWFHDKDVVKDHVISNGFLPRSEKSSKSCPNGEVTPDDIDQVYEDDDIDGLLHDTFGKDPIEDTNTFYKSVKEGQQELYPGCKNFSKLSFTIRLFLFKCDHKISNTAFADLLKLLRAMLPDAKFPASFNEARNTVKALGLNYIRIDACPNDCMLYWENEADATHCHVCKSSRWKPDERDEKTGKPRRIPQKILRYFPVKKRLQILYMCSEIAHNMIWHASDRSDDHLRHPADGKSWKDFDLDFPEFSQEPRNVRLGLATDGFNPFNTMSLSHSTWPVILMNCNLPPWMCMKQEFFMLALLISGPHSPGNDIDIYMQPLIKELNEIWEFGLETYDASTEQMFTMRAALLFTVSDFPGYAMLSGWSTKGKTACPCCHYETCSQRLNNSKKTCYMDHRRFLEMDHPWRHSKRLFHGKVEERSAPTRLSGIEISELLADYKNAFGKMPDKAKKRKKPEANNPWRKRSIFFELPYWKFVSCGHYLDVMHIENNFCENVFGTLLGIVGRTRDHLNARKDMEDMDMMHELHPIERADGRFEIAYARFSLTPEEQRTFCHVIKSAKLPQGCGSNIGRYVHVQERKISGYKSHDAHFLMHNLLPIAVRTTLPRDVALPLMRLSAFFKAICSKVINPEDLDRLQSDIVRTLCEFETIFPPAFFDVMVHLPVHLVEEIRLGGPVTTRWMYPIERYLRKLKSYVRNKGRPEGSMAEGYITEECVTFCARYLSQDIEGSKTALKEDDAVNEPISMLPRLGTPIMGQGNRSITHGSYKIDATSWAQAHTYVLFNCDSKEVESYIK